MNKLMNNSSLFTKSPVLTLNAICISCRIGSEQTLVDWIRRKLGLTAFYPTRIQEEWHKGTWVDRVKPIIDGYVFMYTDAILPAVDALQQLSMTRVLHYDKNDYALYGTDLEFAEWLWKNNGQIGVSEVTMEGKDFVILGGPMKDYQHHIQKVMKQKRYAIVDMSIGGAMKQTFTSFRWMRLIDGRYVHSDNAEIRFNQLQVS